MTPAAAAPSSWLAVDGNIRFTPPTGVVHDWANSGAPAPVNSCPAGPGVVNLSGSGGLFNCGSFAGANVPPNPPVLTPAAAADPSLISSTFIVDPLAGDTTACGVGDPTTFSGAVKNGDPINGMGFKTGPVSNKDDLSNVYAVAHTTASRPELFFGDERIVNNGASHVDFEFLQSVVTISAGCSGSFSGHRSEGDLLLAVDFTIGGSLASDTLYQWHCNPDPGPQPPDGTVCDPPGNPHYQPILIPGSVAFQVNAVDIPCGGWVCRDSTGAQTATVLANDFMEGGIDLTALAFTGCFNTFLPHSRTAPAFTANLVDFAGPRSLPTCRPPALSTSSSPSGSVAPGTAATDSVTASAVGGGPLPAGTVAFFLCAPSQVTALGCPGGGTQIGTVKTLSGAGGATSDATTATTAMGTYCWRAEYTPSGTSVGVYLASSHTDATQECFRTASTSRGPLPGPPDAGFGRVGTSAGMVDPRWPLAAALVWGGALLFATAARPRRR